MPAWSVKDAPRILAVFAAHWTDVDAVLEALPGKKPLVLRGGYGLASLKADGATLTTLEAAILDAANADELAMGRRATGRKAMRERLRQLRNEVEGGFSDTEFAGTLPKIPGSLESDAIWDKTLSEASSLWSKLDAATELLDFTPPLLLQDGYARAQFDLDRAALSASGQAAKTSGQHATDARKTRDAHLTKVRGNLVRYRKLAVSRLPENHPLLESLPDLDI